MAKHRNVQGTSSQQIDVLVVVDTAGATQSNPPNANGNVYMVDTNKFFGSLQESGEELITAAAAGQTIVWSVTPVDPAASVAIVNFTGQAVGHQITPTAQGSAWGSDWSSTAFLDPGTSGQRYQYTIGLQFEGPNGVQLSFDPFILSKQS